jgi:hypothetical protein
MTNPLRPCLFVPFPAGNAAQPNGDTWLGIDTAPLEKVTIHLTPPSKKAHSRGLNLCFEA